MTLGLQNATLHTYTDQSKRKAWPLPEYSKGYMMKVINDSLIRNLKKPGEAHSICELKTTFSFLVLTSLFICAIL